MTWRGKRKINLPALYRLDPVAVEDTDHYRLMREFWADPRTFIATMLEE